MKILEKKNSLFLCLALIVLSLANWNSALAKEMKLVWSDDYGQGQQVYISSYQNGNWTSPKQISDNAEMVYHAVVSSGDDGRVWAVWASQDENRNSFLEFTVQSSAQWAQPLRINTGMSDNRAVTIMVDKNNIPWIAWEGVQNKYSDIFVSRWNGKGWTAPIKMHTDNDVPDIEPNLSLVSSGQVILSWQTFTGGKYVTVKKMWDGSQWQIAPATINAARERSSVAAAENRPAAPPFIKEPRLSSLFVKDSNGARSRPLSDF